MEYIKSWLKTILYMNVLLLICDNLMQKTAYEKSAGFMPPFPVPTHFFATLGRRMPAES